MIYVEGGGDQNRALDTQSRRGFSDFLSKAGLKGRMPRVMRLGGRRKAFDKFRSHLEEGWDGFPILLVDSEAAVTARNCWEHVRLRSGDEWERPDRASEDQIHLMVQTMEAWFYADKDAVEEYYGQGFRKDALSGRTNLEEIPES